MTLDLGDLDQPPFVGQWFFLVFCTKQQKESR